MYQHFELGGYLKGKPEPIAEGVSVRLDNSGLFALLTYEDPTETEIHNLRDGDIQAKIFVKGTTAFFLLKYGDLPWMDTPLKLETSTFPQTDGISDCLSMITLLANALDGRIHVLRYTSLNPAFSQNICELVAPSCQWEQAEFGKWRAMYNTLQMVSIAQFEN